MRETLSNLGSTLDWENQGSSPAYFDDIPSLDFATGGQNNGVTSSTDNWDNTSPFESDPVEVGFGRGARGEGK